MSAQPRLRDLGIAIGTLPTGPANAITDVAGVAVGHATLSDGPVQTGVTAIRTHAGHPFRDKLPAAAHVLNGFGKSIGLMQVAELGTLETPIVLTNTLSVGTAATALVRHMLAETPEIGASTGTVNPVVMECNDGAWLNDIRGLHVSEDDVLRALQSVAPTVVEGNVGAGTGMSCYGLAGGIGTASRVVTRGPRQYTAGVLTLCNMGRMEDLRVDGRPVGQRLVDRLAAEKASNQRDGREHGSIIMIIATDAPLDARQLRRLAVRAGAGLARTGTHFGSGSGDIMLAFSTAEPLPHVMSDDPERSRRSLHEDALDGLFRAVIEATEEAILNALLAARPTVGNKKRIRRSLTEFADLIAGD
ncbi:P1 family peptidase [Thalassobaculum sp.]|uniref:DmpA family aminopeptidase n=1 Tax=Thalassobaculum sp. TaxID=2022740 RepID=UPI0032EB2B45